ncbi:uncharacterized protein LOC144161998 [Haemaphysalis longicornis]
MELQVFFRVIEFIILEKERGRHAAAAAITMGIMLSYTVGHFVDWRTPGAVCFLCSVVHVCAGHFSVKSPRWLILKNRNGHDSAGKAARTSRQELMFRTFHTFPYCEVPYIDRFLKSREDQIKAWATKKLTVLPVIPVNSDTNEQ